MISEFTFVKMLTQKNESNDKRGISYNNIKHNNKSQTTFLKVHTSIDACVLAPIIA